MIICRSWGINRQVSSYLIIWRVISSYSMSGTSSCLILVFIVWCLCRSNEVVKIWRKLRGMEMLPRRRITLIMGLVVTWRLISMSRGRLRRVRALWRSKSSISIVGRVHMTWFRRVLCTDRDMTQLFWLSSSSINLKSLKKARKDHLMRTYSVMNFTQILSQGHCVTHRSSRWISVENTKHRM